MKKKTIHVAQLVSEPLGWGSAKDVFPIILHNHSWRTDDTTYQIVVENITDKDIIKGQLTTQRYDVLLVPGGGVGDGECILRGMPIGMNTKKWKTHIQHFVKDGGGYVGICGGAALMTDLNTESEKIPKTILESLYNRSSLHLSAVSSYYPHICTPFNLIDPPEYKGAISYVFSFAPGITKNREHIINGGVPIEYTIDTNHPFFKGYNKDTLKMRWWGGPALQLPDKTNTTIQPIAYYPNHDLSDHPDTCIKTWKYVGGLKGLVKGFYKSLCLPKQIPTLKKLFYTAYLAEGWKPTHHTVQLDHQNKAAITLETYPNKHQGRIVLCAAHPEYMVWEGGRIEEETSDKTTLGSGHHRWHDIQPLSKTKQKEFTHTWWVVRRMIAWAAKIEDLPPIKTKENTKTIQEIIDKKICWDGTLLHNMDMI